VNPSLLRAFNQRMRKISSWAVYINPLMLARKFSLSKKATTMELFLWKIAIVTPSTTQTIVNKFNDFFTNIGPKLASKISPSNVSYKSCLCGSFVNSFFASPTTPEEIINIVSSLKKRNSEGTDCINIKVIKASIYLMAYPLSELCNISFSTGIVLDSQNQQSSSHI